jgi:hypothetical protein
MVFSANIMPYIILVSIEYSPSEEFLRHLSLHNNLTKLKSLHTDDTDFTDTIRFQSKAFNLGKAFYHGGDLAFQSNNLFLRFSVCSTV